MIKVAIVGNIAAGKSEVEKILKQIGYVVYDADKIAHNILDNLSAQLVDIFGGEIIIDGKISRQHLAEIVFNDNNKLEQLNNLIHPEVIKDINKHFERHKNDEYVFVSVPLLFEANMQTMFDKILFVYCDDNLRIERLMKRNNLDKATALQRMISQVSQEEKIQKSDYVIRNEGSLEDLGQQIKKLF